MSSEDLDKKLLETLIDTEELYQNAPCGYLSFLPDGTIIKANKTLLNWLDYQSEEFLFKKKFTDLISKGGVLHFEMFFRPLINATGVVNQLSYDIIRKDNSTLPVFLSAVSSKNSKGAVQAINATLYDVSERKLYEKELLLSRKKAEAERKRFEFLSDSKREIIWTANQSGEIDYVNNRFYQFFNTSAFSAKLALLKVCKDDRFKLLRNWLASVQRREGFKIDIRLENHTGVYEWHSLQADVFFEEDSSQAKWIGSCINIDSHVKSLQKRDEFLNVASHELKTPITSLKAFHQILQRMDLPEKANSFLLKANSSLSSLEFLISSLLDTSQIDAGQFSLNFNTFSIIEVVELCVELISAGQNTHTIEVNFPPGESFVVWADRQRIMQVVINLLTNAIKYSPQANKVEVNIQEIQGSKLVKIEVRDFGLGIPSDKLDLIFDKYYRVSDTKNNNKASGLGLGLYIIQNILKLHQTKLFVNSKINKGTCFYFSLPIREAASKSTEQ